MNKPNYRPDIDGLRAIAILSVLLFHLFPDNFKGGFIGVDIFFVISGYLITSIIFFDHEYSKFSFINFYSRRIKRIFPALILVLFFCVITGWFLFTSIYFNKFGYHLFFATLFLTNFVSLREAGYFDDSSLIDPVHHLWSLGIEEQFYILWPFLLIFFLNKKKTTYLIIFITTISFLFNVKYSHDETSIAFYSPISRFWELITGALLAYVNFSNIKFFEKFNNLKSIFGIGLIVVGFWIINPGSSFPGYLSLLPVVGSFLTISANQQSLLNKYILSNKLLVWIGLISYPLYLWHWPIIIFFRYYFLGDLNLIHKISILLISLILSVFTYQLIERKIRFGSNKRVVLFSLFSCLILLSLAGKYINFNNGFPKRPINRNYLEIKNPEEGYRDGSCFLKVTKPNFSGKEFKSNCDGSDYKTKTPLIFLWGDSFAASLYPGLESQSTKIGFRIAQYTASACPPIVGFKTGNNNASINLSNFIYNQILKLHPDTVILAANWLMYERNSNWDEGLNKLGTEILFLKKAGIKKIILIGQIPTYKYPVPIIADKVFKINSTNKTYHGLNRNIFNIDNKIKLIAKENNIDFYSPLANLCDENGCMLTLSTNKFVLTSYDDGHLTENASRYLIETAVKQNLLNLL